MSHNIPRASNENIFMAKKYSNYSCDIVEIHLTLGYFKLSETNKTRLF